MAVQLKKIVREIEALAPLTLKEKWDNPGLLIGNPEQTVSKTVITLDVMMDTVDYAVEHQADLIISHHPIIFDGLKSLRTDTYDGQMYQKLLSHHIAVYCSHTPLDSADGGVNDILAGQIGLEDIKGLVPVQEDKLFKIVVYVPRGGYGEAVRKALHKGGAGYIGKYSDCSFTAHGIGRFKAHEGTHPFVGTVGSLEKTAELRVETIVPQSRLSETLEEVLKAHPYEEPAYDVYPLAIRGHVCAMGRIGLWPTPEPAMQVLKKIKEALHLKVLPYAGNMDTLVSKIALLGGGGAGFMQLAKKAGAQLYLTGDVKYHDAQNAVKLGLIIADGSHFGTEFPVVQALKKYFEKRDRACGWGIEWIEDPTSKDMFDHCI